MTSYSPPAPPISTHVRAKILYCPLKATSVKKSPYKAQLYMAYSEL